MVTAGKPASDAEARDNAGEFNVFSEHCPARQVLDHIGDKWALLILDRLRGGPVRFNALRREIRGISQKVLSQVLKRLERDGMLVRRVFPTVPVTVEYSLSPLGSNLTDTASLLTHWAEANMPAIRAAQDAYDQAALSEA